MIAKPNHFALPFEDIRNLANQLPQADQLALETVQNRNGELARPAGSLGRLEALCEWQAKWSGKSPVVTRPLVAVFAGTHALEAGLYGQENKDGVLEVVTHLTAGGAAANQACAVNDAGLKVFDLALQIPVANICEEPALDERGCAATIAFGMEAIAGGSDLIALADTGVGNDVSCPALLAALWDEGAENWISREPGESTGRLARRRGAVEAALLCHKGHLGDPLEALRRLGGREHAALVGAILAARVERVPVLLEGLAALAAASVVARLVHGGADHCLIAERPVSGAGERAAQKLALGHVGDFGISLGQGTGGAMAIGIVKTAARIHSDMASRDG